MKLIAEARVVCNYPGCRVSGEAIVPLLGSLQFMQGRAAEKLSSQGWLIGNPSDDAAKNYCPTHASPPEQS